MFRRKFSPPLVCYACDAPANTREHAPAKSFFPKRLRHDLLTVPSCTVHNNLQSLDVEYARCTISFQEGLNDVANEAFEDAKRSFDHSPALTARIASMMKEQYVNLEKKPTLRFEIRRLDKVMIGIAQAAYFNAHGVRAALNWHVSLPLHNAFSLQGGTDHWTMRRHILSSLKYNDLKEPGAEVFVCEEAELAEGNVAYRLTFYGGFVVYVWSGPFDPARLAAREHGSSLWIP
jgi:hypothetical protein